MAASSTDQKQADQKQAKFLTGSMMGHVVTMTVTSSIGLMALFAVDALNLFYIAKLGQQELAAAIGYAGTFQFFLISLSIGMAIATGATVAKALGQGVRERAANMAGAALIFTIAVMAVTSLVTFPFLSVFVELLGARGSTAETAVGFLQIVVPSLPLLGLGMALGGVLRALGDAQRAMYITLLGGFVAAILDPLFIFGFDMGVNGAATSTVLSRCFLAGYGFWALQSKHQLFALPDRSHLRDAFGPFWKIGVPAILTQLATPVGNAYVTQAFASYGDDAVAGWAVVGRLMPLAFGAIFALSGAVGPIIGQNYGAGNRSRILAALRDGMIFTMVYVLVVWAILALLRGQIAEAFDTSGQARELVELFCLVVAGTFFFNGALFVANSAFNNLGYAFYSTVFNWGRATVGVIPFVYLGGLWYGAPGVLVGWGLGAVVFGVVAVLVAFRTMRTMELDNELASEAYPVPPASSSALSSGKGAGLH
ncbi:MAG: MATE family efflux transporter [Pseudomonadota bacterium]